ncbi:MAG: UDP-N-acetylglucosamine 2-epimerase (hydrolyzing) [Oscillospiraceae bacterium]|nr:UDP-N-acetylglucosamine 2-epimerase (hydrolyzing) [Oscillospiraceae bacterium]
MKKRIAVVTSTRADYGLLRPVIAKINESDRLTLSLIVTGTHLLEPFGRTVSEIERDGFPIRHETDILKFGFTEEGTARTIGYTVRRFTDLWTEDRPDAVLVLGDRYEIFAVATAASALSIPIAHISGGDVTRGAKDDFYRHCITKMSSLHFPSCADSCKRVIQLGEDPSTVHNVGGLGNENIKKVPLMSLEEFKDSIGWPELDRFALITYHPVTASGRDVRDDMDRFLKALERTDLDLLFTKSNRDAGGDVINRMVDEFCALHPDRSKAFFSLGLRRYLSAMKYCALVAGNSSSGVVETPAFGKAAVNVGERQDGRFIAENVICCSTSRESITEALNAALSEEHRIRCAHVTNPYEAGVETSAEIVRIVTEWLSGDIPPKSFHDVEFEIH